METRVMPFAVTETSAWIGVGGGLVGIVVGWFLKLLSDSWSHRRTFDQRLRLEKEYQLYAELWEKMFDVRRTIGTAISPFTDSEDAPSDDAILKAFNGYQSVVRRGEPFFSASVYGPSRKASLLSRQM
jgi:hypothetical protein